MAREASAGASLGADKAAHSVAARVSCGVEGLKPTTTANKTTPRSISSTKKENKKINLKELT